MGAKSVFLAFVAPQMLAIQDGALADDEVEDRLRKRQTDRKLGVDARRFL
jgi:hypothetical protein